MRSAVFFGCVLIALNFGSAESLMAADDYKSLFKAKKYAEIERLTSQQLESQPTDTAALIAKAEAILFSEVENTTAMPFGILKLIKRRKSSRFKLP